MSLVLISETYSKQSVVAVLQALSGLQGQPISLAYFPSAPDPDRYYFNLNKAWYETLGVDSVLYVGLEEEYNESKIDKAFNCNVIHLAGGNTYQFLYWLRKRNLEQRLIQFHEQGNVIIGVSAGAIILTPTIDTASLCDDQNTVNLADTRGLNLVPFLYVPHSEKSKKEVLGLKEILHQQPTVVSAVLCSDYDAIVVNNQNEPKDFGKPLWVHNV